MKLYYRFSQIMLLLIVSMFNVSFALEIPFYINAEFRDQEYIPFLAEGELNSDFIAEHQCLRGSTENGRTILRIPVEKIPQIRNSSDLTFLAAKPDFPLLEDSTSDLMNGGIYVGCNADDAQADGYDGNGVIIGIIDYYSLNWKHDDFNKTGWDSDDLRILYIWNQQDDTGKHPNGFDYGSEYSKADLMSDNGPDINSGSHGSQCTGIAAGDGSGSGTGAPDRGIADGADLIYIHKEWDQAGTLDAIAYLQNKAVLLNRPIVISFSGGTKYGFPDGSDPVSEALDLFSTSGRLASVAAGNYYTTSDHAYGTALYNSPATDISFKINSYSNTGSEQFDDYLDAVFFFKEGDNFDVTVTDPDDITYNTTVTDNDESFDTASGRLYIYHNDDASLEIIITDESGVISFDDVWSVDLEVPDIGSDDEGGKWSAWLIEENITAQFISYNTASYTLNVYACGNDCFCVGAHSKTSGSLYSGCSVGPTIDGRQKPELTAPTNAITTSNTSSNSYSALGATSGAAPHLAGSLALMLERDPGLTPEQAETILTEHVFTDDITDDYGEEPNSRFGYGKLNTYGSVNDSSLPVSLSTFTSQFMEGSAFLNWMTMSETNNLGWNIFRALTDDPAEASLLNYELIPGAGTTSEITEYSYQDESSFQPETSYWYWLESVSGNGESEFYDPVCLTTLENIEDPNTPNIHKEFGLYQNYPNPFNPDTQISFALTEDCECELKIFNIRGQMIRNIFRGNIEKKKIYSFNWDGKDESGKDIDSGMYFYQIQAGKYKETKKMLLLR